MTSTGRYRPDPVASAILAHLLRSSDRYLSGADLSRSLQVSRNTVWKHVRHLRALGCVLEGRASTGYRLGALPDSLRPEIVTAGLSTKILGRTYVAYETVGSTNDACHELARAGAPEGTVVAAESQTKGRGRLSRKWHLPRGRGLAFSVLLRPALPAEKLPLVTLASAVGVALAFEDAGARPGIKWPNDVELDGRKTCGILTETQAEIDRLQYAVVGIGVNVNARDKDFPLELRDRAGSLFQALGRPVNRPAFFRSLLGRLEEVYGWLRAGHPSRVLKEWRARSTVLGHQVRIHQGTRSLFGQALDVDAHGALLVRNDVGITERVTAGDVETLRLERPRPGAMRESPRSRLKPGRL